MNEPAFILSVAVIIIGPTMACFLAHIVMKNRDKAHAMTFETRRLFFAAAVLVGLGFLFFEAMILHFYGRANGSDNQVQIFDTCKTVLPPIVTLILGFYFGTTTSLGPKSDNK